MVVVVVEPTHHDKTKAAGVAVDDPTGVVTGGVRITNDPTTEDNSNSRIGNQYLRTTTSGYSTQSLYRSACGRQHNRVHQVKPIF